MSAEVRKVESLAIGLVVGAVFGTVNALVTWLYPLLDDSPAALLRFYGPMFFIWALASFRAARRSGRALSGVATGAIVAFGTFALFEVFIFVRINLFLDELTQRADWQNMMLRFRASGVDSLRLFVNLDYLRGAPFKWAVACAIGASMGGLGGFFGHLLQRRIVAKTQRIY
jgi:hypothetical protein